MTKVRTIPAHEIVRRTFPRPEPEEKDLIAMAAGRAIDGALSRYGHEIRLGRRPTQTSIQGHARELLAEALEASAVSLAPGEEDRILAQVQRVVQAYRRSAIVGLARPKTRVILIDGAVGVYAQPDYWDGRGRFYEMKSYRAIPPPPDVLLQLRLFQLAFPECEAVLFCLNRHADPVETISATVPRPTSEEAAETLKRAFSLGAEFGEEKVLEYLEGPFVSYPLPRSPAP